jgi:hypothetical protein
MNLRITHKRGNFRVVERAPWSCMIFMALLYKNPFIVMWFTVMLSPEG